MYRVGSLLLIVSILNSLTCNLSPQIERNIYVLIKSGKYKVNLFVMFVMSVVK